MSRARRSPACTALRGTQRRARRQQLLGGRSARRVGDQRGRGGHGHRADHGLAVLVGGVRGDLGLVGGLLGVAGVPGAERGDAHGGAVAPRALAVEQPGGQLPPVGALVPDQPQHAVDGRAVAAVEVMVLGEGAGQRVLVDAAVRGQHGQHGAGHLGVVGPLPGAGRQLAPLEGRVVGGDEELGAEGVADGQPAQAGQGAARRRSACAAGRTVIARRNSNRSRRTAPGMHQRSKGRSRV